jgi:uncharacterized membrane protein
VSTAGRPGIAAPELPAEWERLERAAARAAESLSHWRARALQAENEVVQLRDALEAVAMPVDPEIGASEQLRHLRAENAALRSRAAQAHRRVLLLLRWLGSVERAS